MNTEKHYIVAPKDCLWNLAKRFYQDPLKWPAIFKYNNQADIAKKNGTCIIDPDLIYIGQKLIIPTQAYADSVSYSEIQQIKAHVCKVRQQHSQKGNAEKAQVERIRKDQPQPDKGGEPMARRFAQPIAKPAYSFDLGTINFGQVKAGGFVMKLNATGTLVIKDSNPAHITLTAQNLTSLKFSSEQQAKTEIGKLLNNVGFKFDPKTKNLTLTGGIASQSNIKDAPTIKLQAATNSKGGQVLKGSATYDVVKGGSQTFSFVGQDVGFEIELSASGVAELPKTQPVASPVAQPSATNDWVSDAAMVGGAVLLTAGAIGLITVTLVEDVATLGAGVADDPLTFAVAGRMLMSAGQIFARYSQPLKMRLAAALGISFSTPLATAEETTQQTQ
jgi:hypothetical protein